MGEHRILRRAARGVAVALLAVLAACSGSSSPHLALTTTSTTTAAVPWSQKPLQVESPAPTQGEATSAQLEAIAATPTGYVAVGSTASQFRAWTSTDGFDWTLTPTPIDSSPCCGPASPLLLPFRLSLVAISPGTGSGAGPALWLTKGEGQSWTRVAAPWATPDVRAASVEIVGGELFVNTARTLPNSAVDSALWRSGDGFHWDSVTLPSPPPRTFYDVGSTSGGTIDVIATAQDAPATQTWYRSTDGGATFKTIERPAIAKGAVTFVGSIGAALVAYVRDEPAGSGNVGVHYAIASTTDGVAWRTVADASGILGDAAYLRLSRPTSATTASYMVVNRILRDDLRYCFESVRSCQQSSPVLVSTSDGNAYSKVDVTMPAADDAEVVAKDDGSLLVYWSAQGGGSVDHVVRWKGPQPPALSALEPIAPPVDSSQVYTYRFDGVAVGATVRAQLALGGCGGGDIAVGSREFLLQDPPQPPFPTSWPYQEFQGGDGPLGYVYVTGKRVDDDTFEFKVDSQTTFVYKYDPSPPTAPVCG